MEDRRQRRMHGLPEVCGFAQRSVDCNERKKERQDVFGYLCAAPSGADSLAQASQTL